MSQALAPAKVDPEAASSSGKSKAPSEVSTIAILVAATVGLGVAVQFFVAPGPVPLAVTTVAVSVGLIAASLVLKGHLLNTLAGFRLATVTLGALAAAAALGTLILQGKPAETYTMQYGAFAPVIRLLRLDDIFHSVWFGGLMALMIAGLVLSAVRRLPITLKNAGFFATHLGIIVSLAGAGLSGLFAVRGRIDLHVGGGPVSAVEVTGKGGAFTGEKVPLGSAIVLDQFDIDHYKDQYLVTLYRPGKSGNWELKASFENEVAVKNRLPGDASFRLRAYYPDLTMTEKVTESADGAPALKITLDGRERWLMPGQRAQALSADGTVGVAFGWERPDATFSGPLHTLMVAGEEPRAVRVGETVTLTDGTPVKVAAFYPHFSIDLETRQVTSLSDKPVNPALEVLVGKDQPARRYLFANMQGHGGGGGPELAYSYAPEGGRGPGTLLKVQGSTGQVAVIKESGEETAALKDGLELAGVRFGPMYRAAKIEQVAANGSDQPNNPAALIEITEGGASREVLLVASRQDVAQVGKDSILTFEKRGEEVKSFRSHVTVERGAELGKAVISVNDPLTLPGGWMLYQTNYDPKDPTYSGIEAVRDPGVNWVFAGFGFLFFGVAYMIYVQPRIKRKEA